MEKMGDKFTESIIVSSIQRVNPDRSIALRLCNSSRSRRDFLVEDAGGLLIYFPYGSTAMASPPNETVILQISRGEGCEWFLMVEPNRTQALNIRLMLQPHEAKFSGTCNKSYLLLLLGDSSIYISHSLSICRAPIRRDTDTMAPLINLSSMEGNSQGSIPSPIMQGLRNRLEAARQLQIREKAMAFALKQSLGMKLPGQFALSNLVDAAEMCAPIAAGNGEETEEKPNLHEIAYKSNEPSQNQLPPMDIKYLSPEYESRKSRRVTDPAYSMHHHDNEHNSLGSSFNIAPKPAFHTLLAENPADAADESPPEYNSMEFHKRAREAELYRDVVVNHRLKSASYPVTSHGQRMPEIGLYSAPAMYGRLKSDASMLKIFFSGPILCNHNWRQGLGYPPQQVTIGCSPQCDFILPFPGIPDVMVAIIPPSKDYAFFRIQNIDDKRFINTDGKVIEDVLSSCELSPERIYNLSHMASFYVEIVTNPEADGLIVMPDLSS